jgi:hypothetical protein
MTGVPAFDEARVGVLATRDNRLELRLSDDESTLVRTAADRAGVSMSEVVRSSLAAHTSPRPVYPLIGGGHQYVRDLWIDRHPQEERDALAARDRLAAHRGFMRELQLAFATATTANGSQVIPPGYRPLLATSTADRPLHAAATRGELTDATPFAIPGAVAETSIGSGATPHTEGTNPTDGTLTFEGKMIVPQGISGLFRVTRELVDSSNPVVDQIAFNAMREDYDRQVETEIYDELNTVQAARSRAV